MMMQLQEHGRPLNNPEACLGIVSLELPFTKEKAAGIIHSWKGEGLTIARVNIQKDFLFLLLYPLAFSMALVLASESKTVGWGRSYLLMSWLSLAMMPLDAMENLLMLKMIDTGPTVVTALATSLAAGTKFLILLAAICLLLRAVLRLLLSKLIGGKFSKP